jgi:hypothetical protein
LANSIAPRQPLTTSTPGQAEVNESSEVNNFVGWAISSLLQKWRNNTDKGKTTKKEVLADHIVVCLECMRIMHQDAIEDQHYSTQLYSADIKIRNQGGLALVSPPFFHWAMQLLSMIRAAFTEEALKKNASNCMQMAFDDVTLKMNQQKGSFHEVMKMHLDLKKLDKTQTATEEAIEAVRQKVIKKVFMQEQMSCSSSIKQQMLVGMETKILDYILDRI